MFSLRQYHYIALTKGTFYLNRIGNCSCLCIGAFPLLIYKHLQVMLNEDEVSELESENRILLRPPDEREVNRIKPNPTLRVQPIFIDPGVTKKPVKGKQANRCLPNGLCLEITGRVQHDNNE